MSVFLTARRRVLAFAIALGVTALMVLATAALGWRVSGRISRQITQEELDLFSLGDEFNDLLRSLQTRLLRFTLGRETADWPRLETDLHGLDAWIDRQKSRLVRRPERDLLEAIDQSFEVYAAAARRVRTEVEAGGGWPRIQPAFEAAEQEVQRLGEIDTRLLRAHNDALAQSLSVSRDQLRLLLGLLFGALAGLMGLALWLAWLVWRELIGPLRRQLVHSRDQLARHEKLASLGVLAAGVAHEIRNPLTAIKARLYTQQKSLPPDSPAGDDARVITGEINRLERIVRGFLEFARPAEPVFGRVEIPALLHEVYALAGPGLERDGRRVSLGVVESVVVSGDHDQLKQVLLNLVRNAAEATGPGGRIRLDARLAARNPTGSPGRSVRLEVTDSGPGIPAEIQARLFDPFFTTKAEGSGLGLSIVARIVENHGGVVEFQTQPGVNTTFAVLLPAAPNPTIK